MCLIPVQKKIEPLIVFRIFSEFGVLYKLIVKLSSLFIDSPAAPVLDNFLLFADGPQGKLFQMGLNGTVVMEIPIQKRQNPVAVDYDPVERMVYWSDVETRTIRRTKLEGGSSEEPFISLMPGN